MSRALNVHQQWDSKNITVLVIRNLDPLHKFGHSPEKQQEWKSLIKNASHKFLERNFIDYLKGQSLKEMYRTIKAFPYLPSEILIFSSLILYITENKYVGQGR